MNREMCATTTTVWDKWFQCAEKKPNHEAVIHWVTGEEPYRWLWADLIERAIGYGSRLTECGIRKGDVCAIMIRHNRKFYPIYMAVSGLGALPAVLAYPNSRLHPEKFEQGLEGMARRSGLRWVLTERELEPILLPMLARPGSTIEGLIFPLEWDENGTEPSRLSHPKVAPEEPCLLQHSSGTTGLQKAVVLSHRAILEHVKHYGRSIGISVDDKVVSWLPLYHDMGLIAAFYLPLTLGIPLIQMDPFEWVSAPVILLEALSRERGTIAWLPNFAYNLMADRVSEEDLKGIRLDSVRMLINCSEPIRAESHDRFFRRFARLGLRQECLSGCYAMAETTFAATQCSPGAEAKRLRVHRENLSRGTVQLMEEEDIGVRVCVSSGKTIEGCVLRVVDDYGERVPDARVGEIAISSVSLFDGYKNNLKETREVLKNGWYLTGDYGFVHEGECYVIGRKKDLIIVGGKNIYPEDIEDTVSQIAGIIPGRVTAFGIEDPDSGTEQICVVVETALSDLIEQKALRLSVRETANQIGLTISRVYLAPPRWLIKSSAGKPSRKANRERAIVELKYR